MTGVQTCALPIYSLYSTAAEFSIASGGENVGSIYGISTRTGHTAWKYEQRSMMLSLLTTGGHLLFGGDGAGRFRALDQETGKVLWEVNLGSAVTGFPIAFAVNGKEYVAVSTGVSVLTGMASSLTPEVRVSAANNIFVFALPD